MRGVILKFGAVIDKSSIKVDSHGQQMRISLADLAVQSARVHMVLVKLAEMQDVGFC